MTDNKDYGRQKLVAFQIGESMCVTTSLAVTSINEVPASLTLVPGTKPWLMGVIRNDLDLIPYINLSHFLSIHTKDRSDRRKQAALIIEGPEEVGAVGLVVDEIHGFFEASLTVDAPSSNVKTPPALGSCVVGAVGIENQCWAVIDLLKLLEDEKLKLIEMN